MLALTAKAHDALVRTPGEMGVAALRVHAGECYAITAAHVLGDNVEVRLTLAGGHETRARLIRGYEQKTGIDLALLKVEGSAFSVCEQASWKPTRGLNALLGKARAAWVLTRRESGEERYEVFIERVGDEKLTIQMRDPSKVFAKGMSGSTLVIDGVFAGVVTARIGTDRAEVYRADQIDALFSFILPMLPPLPRDAFQVWTAAGLEKSEAAINMTNTSGTESLCVNVYVFDPTGHMAACCPCMILPNAFTSLYSKKDLLSNMMTPGMPTSARVTLISSRPIGLTCDPGSPKMESLVGGMLAWGTRGGVEQAPFTPVDITESTLKTITSECEVIRTRGSGYGQCRACRVGASTVP